MSYKTINKNIIRNLNTSINYKVSRYLVECNKVFIPFITNDNKSDEFNSLNNHDELYSILDKNNQLLNILDKYREAINNNNLSIKEYLNEGPQKTQYSVSSKDHLNDLMSKYSDEISELIVTCLKQLTAIFKHKFLLLINNSKAPIDFDNFSVESLVEQDYDTVSEKYKEIIKGNFEEYDVKRFLVFIQCSEMSKNEVILKVKEFYEFLTNDMLGSKEESIRVISYIRNRRVEYRDKIINQLNIKLSEEYSCAFYSNILDELKQRCIKEQKDCDSTWNIIYNKDKGQILAHK